MINILFLILLFVSCASATPRQESSFGDKSFGISYPDYNLTPGKTVPGVTKEDVCQSGYSKRIRSQLSAKEKSAVYQEYSLTKDNAKYQIDHLVPIGLGGSNDMANLWPIPKINNAGFNEKQRAAQWLHDQVCSGKMEIGQAQELMIHDWHDVYMKSRGKR
jgi:5-methylcytosine-specific restriction endonuclease McrA